jgi:hypothetical protein
MERQVALIKRHYWPSYDHRRQSKCRRSSFFCAAVAQGGKTPFVARFRSIFFVFFFDSCYEYGTCCPTNSYVFSPDISHDIQQNVSPEGV